MQAFPRFFATLLTISTPCFAIAQDAVTAPAPFPEFSSRRVTVPAAGHQGPRINIQIGDGTGVRVSANIPQISVATSQRPTGNASAWFWSEIEPAIDASSGRFTAALQHLSNATETADLPVLNVESLNDLAATHGRTILEATVGTQLSPAFVLAIIAVESAGQELAASSAGAQGLMQLIPATAERFGVEDPFDPAQNIAGGVAYLDWLMGEFDRDPILTLAGYNAGEGAVREAGGVPNYAETRNYIPRVLETWRIARLLCLTPPELVWDGCVFRAMLEG